MIPRTLCAAAVAALLGLSGCAALFMGNASLGGHDPEGDLLTSVDGTVRSEWADYGAYYEVDEVYIKADYLRMPYVSTPVTRVYVNRRIRILTDKGTEYATVDIPLYTDEIEKFVVFLEDSSGKRVPLDADAMKKEFVEKGEVVFPQAHAGCVLGVVVASRSSQPMYSFEHWFSSEIPVSRGRVTLLADKNFVYESRSYANAPYASTSSIGDYVRRQWTMRSVLPRARLENQESVDMAEPRAAFVMRTAFDVPVASNWSRLAGQFKEFVLGDAQSGRSRLARGKAARLSLGMVDTGAAVDAVLEWIQDSISMVSGDVDDIDVDEVMRNRQGTVWEITSVLGEMLRGLGFRPNVLVTRARSRGGFDPDFVDPSALRIPLVAVNVNGREQVAFPFAQGGMLGEYPRELFDMHALSLKTSRPRPLPAPRSRKSYLEYTVTIDSNRQHLDLEMRGYAAYRMRSSLYSSQEKEVKEVLQAMLTGMGTSNALTSYTIEGVHDRGGPISVGVDFATPGQVVERKGSRRLSLSHLFRPRYESYDTSRGTAFTTREEYEVHETVRFVRPAGKMLRYDIPCTEIANSLFDCSCSVRETEAELTFTRVVTGQSTSLSPESMRPVAGDIQQLNEIESAFIITE